MRLAHFLAVACIVGATPVHAEINHARTSRASESFDLAFSAMRMNDVELAQTVGTGGVHGDFLRDSANVNARLVEQQSGQVLVTTFDNWFTEIGSTLIFSNIIASR